MSNDRIKEIIESLIVKEISCAKDDSYRYELQLKAFKNIEAIPREKFQGLYFGTYPKGEFKTVCIENRDRLNKYICELEESYKFIKGV